MILGLAVSSLGGSSCPVADNDDFVVQCTQGNVLTPYDFVYESILVPTVMHNFTAICLICSQYTPAMGTVSTVTTLLGVHMHPCVFPRRHSVKIGSGPSRLTIISTTMPEVSIEMANLNVEIDGGCVDGAVSKRNDIEVAHARFRIEITDTGVHICGI